MPNTYCNFDTTGDGVVVGHDSCKVEGACTTLGNGAKIGNGSCNGEEACSHFGELGGSAVVGNNSCNGPFACQNAGSEGDSVIGNNSCNVDVDVGALACAAAGAGVGPERGSSRIGNNSCNDDFTCVAVGALGRSVIGVRTPATSEPIVIPPRRKDARYPERASSPEPPFRRGRPRGLRIDMAWRYARPCA